MDIDSTSPRDDADRRQIESDGRLVTDGDSHAIPDIWHDRRRHRDSTVKSIHGNDIQEFFDRFDNYEHYTDDDIGLMNRVEYERFNGYQAQRHETQKYRLKYPLWRYKEIAEKNKIELGVQLR